MFRNLKPDEVECRINQVMEIEKNQEKQVLVVCLLYKDARCDQKILDETVGVMGWQRKHEEHNGNLFCSVGIYDSEKQQWIWKRMLVRKATWMRKKAMLATASNGLALIGELVGNYIPLCESFLN